MYKTLIAYSQIYVKIYIKNRGEITTEGRMGIA
jgi:hypothetical protein